MENNALKLNQGDYYVGLDVGTNSVGWAVTDEDYNVLKFKGQAMWGVRMFDEAHDASKRRIARGNRRRLARRNQRLMLLELLFAEEIAKIDPHFFLRLKESSLCAEEKSVEGKYSLFNDADFTDKNLFPTIYHLRQALIHSEEPQDVRLVFLALHHIIKHRGHFLFDSDVEIKENGVAGALEEFEKFLVSEYNCELAFRDRVKFVSTLENSDIGITTKKKMLLKE